MYVAITRARKRLYHELLSQTRMLHGQTRYNVKSRFFDELPEAALKWITPRNQAFGSGFATRLPECRVERADRACTRSSAPGNVDTPAPGSFGAGPVVSAKTPVAWACDSGHDRLPCNKFGEGVIVTLEGSGDDARAQVNFGRHGMKWLALSVAKLTPVE